MTIYAFTGSRAIPSHPSARWLEQFILNPPEPITLVLHGDCLGADELFHNLIRTHLPDVPIYIHPCILAGQRAFCDGDRLYSPRPPLVRNHTMVFYSDRLIALPDGPEKLRSGTWATVRYARGIGHPIHIGPEG